MATGRIYNAYGGYEERDGVVGTTISYAGIPFFLPYQKVFYMPNFTLREVDHDRSTAAVGERAEVVYRPELVMGHYIVSQMCEGQIPYSNSDMGIVAIQGKPTGKTIQAWAGWDSEGQKIFVDVPEVEPTKGEVGSATANAKRYKESIIGEYFQSKRERMTGGRGLNVPSPRVRQYMDELGVEDIDDVAAHAKNTQADPVFLRNLLVEALKASSADQMSHLADAVNQVRTHQKAKLTINKGHPLNLEEEKAKREEAEAKWNALTPEEQQKRKEFAEQMRAARAAAREGRKQDEKPLATP